MLVKLACKLRRNFGVDRTPSHIVYFRTCMFQDRAVVHRVLDALNLCDIR